MSDEVLTEPKPKRERKALVPTAPPEPGWLGVIHKMLDRGADASLLEKVFQLQREADQEMQRKAFVQAFSDFKSEAPSAIERTGKVSFPGGKGQVQYDHVELDVAVAALTPILSKHGLAHSWETSQAEGGLITVSCRLEHVAGYSRMITLRAGPDNSGSKNAIQAVASTVYYLERYTLLAVLGIAQKCADNDGQIPGDTLIAEERDIIEQLLERSKADRARFLKVAGVQTVEEIPRKDFAKWEDMLLRKVKQVEAQT